MDLNDLKLIRKMFLCWIMRFILILIGCLFSFNAQNTVLMEEQKVNEDKPIISFTFDDGKTSDLGGYKLIDWHGRILRALDKHQLKAIMFVAGHNKKTANGKYVLSTWNDAGHFLANHTLNHPNFNDDAMRNGLVLSHLGHCTRSTSVCCFCCHFWVELRQHRFLVASHLYGPVWRAGCFSHHRYALLWRCIGKFVGAGVGRARF